AARKAGVKKMIAAAFTGETDPVLQQHVDVLEWMRVGQLNRLLTFFRAHDIHHAIMAGQIAPKNLFDLRPDWKALMLLGTLKERNAESIFAAIADELARSGAVMVKTAKPSQDLRFDVGVIGVETMRVAAEAKLRVIAVEAGKTLLLERDAIVDLANHSKISIVGRTC